MTGDRIESDYLRPGTAQFLVAVGTTLLLGMTLLSPSATRMQVWPWAVFAAVFWTLPILVALFRLAYGRPRARLGGMLDAGFALLVVSATVSLIFSPLKEVLRPNLLPFLGACALPYALLPLLGKDQAIRSGHLLSGIILLMVLVSLGLWLHPWDWSGWPESRNAFPFGHGNATGSFGVLAVAAMFVVAARTKGAMRAAAIGSAWLAMVLLISSASRGAVLALAVMLATAAAITLLHRGQRLALGVLLLLIFAGAIASNQRLRELVWHGRWGDSASESNEQRIAMISGGLQLGAMHPLLGWGPGAVPQAFPLVRARLPGRVDNFLQLHNTPVQLWATLGAAGVFAALLLAGGIVRLAMCTVWIPERIWLASGMVGGGVMLLFDHPFALPAIAVLAAAQVAAWANPPEKPLAPWTGRIVAGLGALMLSFTLPAVVRDLAARAAYAGALEAADRNDPRAYAAGLLQASRLMPADPFYSHQLAAHLATGHPLLQHEPGNPAGAIPLLLISVKNNPALEYAHYNLGWLLLESTPGEAAGHFLAAAQLAPQRGGVYLGLGLARARSGDTQGAIRAFACELLNDPTFAWSGLWFNGPLANLRPAVMQSVLSAPLPAGEQTHRLRAAWSQITTPAPAGRTFLRVRTGYGVLLGHPDGPPPVDCNLQTEVLLPTELAPAVPAKGWLGGAFLLDFLLPPPR